MRTAVVAGLLILLSLFIPRARALALPAFFSRLSRRTTLMLALVGVFAFAVAAAVTGYAGVPVPAGHDEFSYLLAADTFSRGRITNPTHPLWPFFETFHVILRPTYMSKFPPAQGLILAAGQLAGHPITGVWLSTAVACVALTWALLAWMPSRWAFAGGLLAPLHPVVVFWSQGYWGGSAALIGGSLVAGSVRRLGVSPRIRDGVILGLGAAILAFSRPYEGLVVTVLSLAMLAGTHRREMRVAVIRATLVPLMVSGGMIAALQGYYNVRITGDPFLMPYVLHERQYSVASVFIFQDPRPLPHYRHEPLRKHHADWELGLYETKRTAAGFVRMATQNVLLLVRSAWGLFTAFLSTDANKEFLPRWFSAVLLIPLSALPWVLKRDPWMRAAAVLLVIFTLALLPVYWVSAHYAAPAAPYASILLLASLRQCSVWRIRRRTAGVLIVRAVLLTWLLSFVFFCRFLALLGGPQWIAARYRLAFVEGLGSAGGAHLILVRYSPEHDVHFEWVYNEAEIDAAGVVWARYVDPDANRRLVSYFNDRTVWLLDADASRPVLIPYTGR